MLSDHQKLGFPENIICFSGNFCIPILVCYFSGNCQNFPEISIFGFWHVTFPEITNNFRKLPTFAEIFLLFPEIVQKHHFQKSFQKL